MVPEEYDGVLDVLEQAYGFTKQFWLRQFPGVHRQRFICDDHFITLEDQRVVGHVGVYPLPLMVDGISVLVGGMGSVATHPRYQGRGHFRRLMEHVNATMRDRGYPFAVLWGRTQRYRHFGYEPAGMRAQFRLRPRPAPTDRHLEVRGMEPERDLEWVVAAHEREPLRVQRSRERHLELLTGAAAQTWVGEGDGGRAYVALSDDDIAECGGEPRCCADLLAHLVRSYDHLGGAVNLPGRDTALVRLLYEESSHWQVEPSANVKVLDLAATLRCFRHQMELKLRAVDAAPCAPVTLAVANTEQRATISWDGSLAIEPGHGGEVVTLGEREMVRLLFGPTLERHGKAAGTRSLLGSVFPLEFYIWPLDYV